MRFGDQVRSFLESLPTRGLVVKGIRRILQGESDPAFGLKPDFIRGVQILPEYGLSFDLLVKGAAQTVGAGGVGTAAATLEQAGKAGDRTVCSEGLGPLATELRRALGDIDRMAVSAK